MSDSMYNRIRNGEFSPPAFNRVLMKKYCEEHGKDFPEELQEHRKNERKSAESFEQACLEDVGLIGHPNANAIFAYAWQEGHASGLYEVYMCLRDISDLFFDPRTRKVLNAHKEN